MIKKKYFLIIFFFLNNCVTNVLNEESILNFHSNSSLSVVTWNIEWFPKHEKTIDLLAELIIDINAEVFGLQEITNYTYFDQLINKINDLDQINTWIGFRSGTTNSNYQELAFIIKNSSISINKNPYSILDGYSHFFAYREPYVIEFSYLKNDFIIINNHFKCCGDGYLVEDDWWDEEYRRKEASILLKNYVDENFSEKKVIIIGDLNDILDDIPINNIFNCFINEPSNYQFADMEIALGAKINWSFPDWPSHLDHILITNELFNIFYNSKSKIQTLHVVNSLHGDINQYKEYISDHLPVGIQLILDP